MSVTYTAQRVGILVDVQNMYYSAYDCFRGRLNYSKLLELAGNGRQVVRAIAYAMRDGNNQSPFFTMLREVGFEVRTKEPKVRPDGTRKGGWDMGIALEALTLAPKLDVVALVSGDGDFVDLVKALSARGVRVEVYAFERSVGRELREAADLFVPLGEEMIFREVRADHDHREERREEWPHRAATRVRETFGAGILDEEDSEEPEDEGADLFDQYTDDEA